MTAARVIAVCADDFGLSEGVNRAIIEGVDAGRLSAVSCMSTAPAWEGWAHRLATAAEGRADLGLHVNLSEGFDDQPAVDSLRRLIVRAYAGLLSREALRTRIDLQLRRFEDTFGCAPDFVDGHQHVHQLPIVREVLLAELVARYGAKLPWLRDTTPPPTRDSRRGDDARKHAFIARLGARRMRERAQALGFSMNQGFVGVYGFQGDEDGYLRLLEGWLDEAVDGSLLMCHPGLGEMPARDRIAAARRREHAVLMGDGFERALQARGCRVGRLLSDRHP